MYNKMYNNAYLFNAPISNISLHIDTIFHFKAVHLDLPQRSLICGKTHKCRQNLYNNIGVVCETAIRGANHCIECSMLCFEYKDMLPVCSIDHMNPKYMSQFWGKHFGKTIADQQKMQRHIPHIHI